MTLPSPARAALALSVTLSVAACGGGRGSIGGIFNWGSPAEAPAAQQVTALPTQFQQAQEEGTIWDLFANNDDANVTVNVNKYLWNASLEILNFLPVETVDPFTGVIVTGYGTPPGGGRSYRATILIQDPALDARSLNLSLQSRGGAVSPETTRAIEDAILTRARQLRIRDANL